MPDKGCKCPFHNEFLLNSNRYTINYSLCNNLKHHLYMSPMSPLWEMSWCLYNGHGSRWIDYWRFRHQQHCYCCYSTLAARISKYPLLQHRVQTSVVRKVSKYKEQIFSLWQDSESEGIYQGKINLIFIIFS